MHGQRRAHNNLHPRRQRIKHEGNKPAAINRCGLSVQAIRPPTQEILRIIQVTAKVREFNGQYYWDENGTPKTLERGRFNWFGRDPDWKDRLGYRGPKDIEKPLGGHLAMDELYARNYDAAERAAKVALELNPRDGPALTFLRMAYEGKDDLDKAVEVRARMISSITST